MTPAPLNKAGAEYYPTCPECGSASQGRGYFGNPYCGLCERSIYTGDIDTLPGRMSTIAGFLGDYKPLPELPRVTTPVRKLNPDLWPSEDGEGDKE